MTLPAVAGPYASGNKCRNTSPSNPPTAKLNRSFSLSADTKNTQERVMKGLHQMGEYYIFNMPRLTLFSIQQCIKWYIQDNSTAYC